MSGVLLASAAGSEHASTSRIVNLGHCDRFENGNNSLVNRYGTAFGTKRIWIKSK